MLNSSLQEVSQEGSFLDTTATEDPRLWRYFASKLWCRSNTKHSYLGTTVFFNETIKIVKSLLKIRKSHKQGYK